MTEGISIRYERGSLFVPYEAVPENVIFIGPTSDASYRRSLELEVWIHIPSGVIIDNRINRSFLTTTFLPLETLIYGVLPAIPINSVPSVLLIDGVLRAILIDSLPPAIPIDNNSPARKFLRI